MCMAFLTQSECFSAIYLAARCAPVRAGSLLTSHGINSERTCPVQGHPAASVLHTLPEQRLVP